MKLKERLMNLFAMKKAISGNVFNQIRADTLVLVFHPHHHQDTGLGQDCLFG